MEDFDIKEFAKMFDAALASDNPAVKKALRNFMMIAALVHAQEDDERNMGPLETLIKKVGDLEQKVYEEIQHNRARRDYKDYYYGSNPTWVYQQPTTSISTTSGTTSWGNSAYTASEISDLLKDLKFSDE